MRRPSISNLGRILKYVLQIADLCTVHNYFFIFVTDSNEQFGNMHAVGLLRNHAYKKIRGHFI